jgi:hypothetical protein
MTAALLQPTAQPISPATLEELLSSQGQCHENLGVGVREALTCYRDAMAFYALPAALEQPLERFADCLRQAIAALEEAREVLQSEAD